MTKKRYFIGLDIGGTKIAAGLVDVRGKIYARNKLPTPQGGTGEDVFSSVRQCIEDLLKKNNVALSQIEGVGAGVPGIVKPNHKDILITPNVDLAGYPLAGNLKRVLKAKVVLGNDVNLGLLGEKWRGVGKNVGNIIGLFPGTGVGGAIIIDGKLVSGSQGAAGELGHMIIDLNSKKQSAGLYGTLEALASRRAIERDIRDAVKKGEKTIVTKILGKKMGVIKSKVIAQALKKKDPVVVKIVKNASNVLGQACVSIRHIFNPDMIILGGGVIEACGDYILKRVQKISDKDPFFKGVDQCVITQSSLGDDAVILGAVSLIRSNGWN